MYMQIGKNARNALFSVCVCVCVCGDAHFVRTKQVRQNSRYVFGINHRRKVRTVFYHQKEMPLFFSHRLGKKALCLI